MTRVDHQINAKMRLFVRYSFDKDSNVLPNFAGGSVADENDLARRQYSTIQLSDIVRPTLINSLRFAFNRTYQNFDDVVSNPAAKDLSFIPGKTFGTISFGSQGLNGQGGRTSSESITGRPEFTRITTSRRVTISRTSREDMPSRSAWISSEFRTTRQRSLMAGATTLFWIYRLFLPTLPIVLTRRRRARAATGVSGKRCSPPTSRTISK